MRRVIERPEWRLHARLPAFKRRVARSIGGIEEWLGRCARPYIALSGGKDSTVTLALARGVLPSIRAVYFDDEWELPETTAYLAGVPNLIRIANTAYHGPGFTAWDYPDPPPHLPDGAVWTGKIPGPLWLRHQGYDGAGIGLRMDENTRRRVHIKTKGRCFRRTDNGLWQCYPVADWSIFDIWAYLFVTGEPYNAAYDRMDTAGIEPDRQRVGPIYTDQAYCGCEISARLWPDLWRRFLERHPLVAT